MKPKRILFWLLLLTFILSCAWWILYFPYNAERLYRAVPSNAIFISEHANLAGRWKSMARNPMVLGTLKPFGIGERDVSEILADPVINDMVNRFAGKNSVIAYVPALGASGEPAWVCASWGGMNAQLQRWGFFSAMLRDFKPIRLDSERIWVLEPDKTQTDQRLSVAVSEGILLGCYSKDPLAVRYLVERLDQRDQLADPLYSRRHEESYLSSPDMAWIILPADKAGGQPAYLRVGITACEQAGLSGWVRTKLFPADTNNVTGLSGTKELRRVLGDAPEAFVIVPSEDVEAIISAQWTPAFLKLVARSLKQEMAEQGAFFACLLKPEFSGRILGIKIPSAIAGMQMKDGGKALEMVKQTLDKLNARYNLALIPARAEVDGQPMIVIESSKSGTLYSSMKSEDRAAFAVRGNWLVFSSNMTALRKLMAAWQDAEAANQRAATPEWEKGMYEKQASAYAWIDLTATGNALKDIIAVVSLATIAKGSSEEGIRQRRALNQARMIVDAVSAMRNASFHLGVAGNESELEFQFGEAAPAAQ